MRPRDMPAKWVRVLPWYYTDRKRPGRQKTVVTLTCDLTGDPADETVTYAIDGTTYEIDLAAKQAAELRSLLAPYMEVSRRVTGRYAKSTATAAKGEARKVRAWARSLGLPVPDRGRVPASLITRYRAEAGA